MKSMLLLMLMATVVAIGHAGPVILTTDCIRFAANIDLDIIYDTLHSPFKNKSSVVVEKMEVDTNRSFCDENDNSIRIKITLKNAKENDISGENFLVFRFKKEEGGTKYAIDVIEVGIRFDEKLFPDHKNLSGSYINEKPLTLHGLDLNQSIVCDSRMAIPLTNELTIHLSNLHAEAFSTDVSKWTHDVVCHEDLPHVRSEWKVSEGGETCIMFNANVSLAVKYLMTNNKTSDFVEFIIDQSTVSGMCHKSVQNMSVQEMNVQFKPVRKEGDIPHPSSEPWKMNIYFTNDKQRNGGKAFGIYEVELSAAFNEYTDLFPNASESVHTYSSEKGGKKTFGDVVGASEGHSSTCSSGDLPLEDMAKIHLASFRVQAFSKEDKFNPAEMCEHDVRTSDIVPIVVGACLAGLVIIVLVAYLIGRARAKRQGYASV